MRGVCVYAYVFIFVSIFFVDLNASLTFSGRNSAIAIKSLNSAIKLGNVNKVYGWTQESIVKDFGHNVSSRWVESYSDGTIISQTGGDSIPPTNLVYSNSNAIHYWGPINRTTSNATNWLGTVVRTDSNALLALGATVRTNSNAAAYGIRNNSNAIIGLSNTASALSVSNSNAIAYWTPINRGTSNAVNFWSPINMATSNAVVYQSVVGGDLARNTSNAVAYWTPINNGTSNAVIYLSLIGGDLARNNSNAIAYWAPINKDTSNAVVYQSSIGTDLIKNTSNAVNYLGLTARTDSNAFAYGIKNNSNAILLLFDKMNTSTTSIPAIVQQIKNNSNAIVLLRENMDSIDHGPEDININTLSYFMLYDIYLSDDHMLNIQSSCTFDGGGHFIYLAKDNPNILNIAASSNVVFKNVVFKNFDDSALQLGAGSTFVFGDGVSLELNDGRVVSKPWVFDGSTKINAFGNSINVASSNIQIMQNGDLTIENAVLNGLAANNVKCVGDALITFKDSKLYSDRDYSFTSGSLAFEGDVILSSTNTFNYITDQTSTISVDSALIFEGGLIFNYAPITNNRDLLAMRNKSSHLYLNGCTLNSSTTGMRLTRGNLIIEDKNFITNSAIALSEGICFGDGVENNDLFVNIMPGASMQVNGVLDIGNVN